MKQKFISLFKEFAKTIVILALAIPAVALLAGTWQEPSVAPTGGNVDAPINVGSATQTKIGSLILHNNSDPRALFTTDILKTVGGALLNTGGADYGLIVEKGKVGIGTTAPQRAQDSRTIQLDVNENIVAKDVYLDSPKTGSPRWASSFGSNCERKRSAASKSDKIVWCNFSFPLLFSCTAVDDQADDGPVTDLGYVTGECASDGVCDQKGKRSETGGDMIYLETVKKNTLPYPGQWTQGCLAYDKLHEHRNYRIDVLCCKE